MNIKNIKFTKKKVLIFLVLVLVVIIDFFGDGLVGILIRMLNMDIANLFDMKFILIRDLVDRHLLVISELYINVEMIMIKRFLLMDNSVYIFL